MPFQFGHCLSESNKHTLHTHIEHDTSFQEYIHILNNNNYNYLASGQLLVSGTSKHAFSSIGRRGKIIKSPIPYNVCIYCITRKTNTVKFDCFYLTKIKYRL